MHIGIVSPCSSGPLVDLLPDAGGVDLGCEVHFIGTLVRALIKRGHRVSVITLSSELRERRVLRGPDLAYYVYPQRTQKRMRDLYKVERVGLLDGIRLAKPDVLHAHWTYEFAMACLQTRLPTVITTHDNAFQQLRFSKDLYRLGRLYIQMRVISRAKYLTAVSPYLAQSLQRFANVQIEVIPNPIQISDAVSNMSKQTDGSVRIATVLNGWGARKNPKTAIRAFNVVRREIPKAEMFMFGYDFEVGGPAWQWASSNNLTQNIQFCGLLPPNDLHRKIRKMSILLHPALEESFGMAIVECMALGVPVIAGKKAGGVPWILDEGNAGFLTDVRDPRKIAETIFTSMAQNDDREYRKENARHRAFKLFFPDSVAAQYEMTYEKAISAY